ncbi:hypothetical protein ACLBXO_23205 [Methylobacterium sp. C33D]
MRSKAYRIAAANVISRQRILFDTNIWIFINGVNQGADQNKVNNYSAAYSDLLRNDNEILVTDYVISEFANRCIKIAYDLHCQSKGILTDPRQFKNVRKSVDFEPAMDEIRQNCLDLTRDCTYIPAGGHCVIDNVINEFYEGNLDFTDIVLRDFCSKEQAFFMTDDGDFYDCGLTIITGNPYILRNSDVLA